MKYKCGHEGCDICGGRTCAEIELKQAGKYYVCKFCLKRAIELAIHVSETFSTMIDYNKPCGKFKAQRLRSWKKQYNTIKCPDGILPDGKICPRCKKERAPSGIDGGTWVHLEGEIVHSTL